MKFSLLMKPLDPVLRDRLALLTQKLAIRPRVGVGVVAALGRPVGLRLFIKGAAGPFKDENAILHRNFFQGDFARPFADVRLDDGRSNDLCGEARQLQDLFAADSAVCARLGSRMVFKCDAQQPLRQAGGENPFERLGPGGPDRNASWRHTELAQLQTAGQ